MLWTCDIDMNDAGKFDEAVVEPRASLRYRGYPSSLHRSGDA